MSAFHFPDHFSVNLVFVIAIDVEELSASDSDNDEIIRVYFYLNQLNSLILHDIENTEENKQLINSIVNEFKDFKKDVIEIDGNIIDLGAVSFIDHNIKNEFLKVTFILESGSEICVFILNDESNLNLLDKLYEKFVDICKNNFEMEYESYTQGE